MNESPDTLPASNIALGCAGTTGNIDTSGLLYVANTPPGLVVDALMSDWHHLMASMSHTLAAKGAEQPV